MKTTVMAYTRQMGKEASTPTLDPHKMGAIGEEGRVLFSRLLAEVLQCLHVLLHIIYF